MKTVIRDKGMAGVNIGVGTYVVADQWRAGAVLADAHDGMIGMISHAASFVAGQDVILALTDITVTSRAIQWGDVNGAKVRAKITFWDDDGNHATTGAWIYV